jgi:hypothetical protein
MPFLFRAVTVKARGSRVRNVSLPEWIVANPEVDPQHCAFLPINSESCAHPVDDLGQRIETAIESGHIS